MTFTQQGALHTRGGLIQSAANAPIAIIGIGCRFPGGVRSPSEFWRFLSRGGDAIEELPAARWDVAKFYDPEPGRVGKTNSRWGGFVEGIDHFDAAFFGISPREAARMDPQQRWLLEVAYEALEDAGQPLSELAGTKASVFVGISTYDYANLQVGFEGPSPVDVYSNTGNALSIAANRISYCFDLRGPSAAVDTACSSALTAVHLACQSLWHDGCSLALAGGVNTLLWPHSYVGFSRLGMLSPDGRCKAFDERANGYVRGEGAGIVVLKPLQQALADRDPIYALICATATNQDGHSNGMTVPNQASQEALLREACRRAGIDAKRIHYVEAHGTGTPVGDPIEARALGAALSAGRSDGAHCWLGSVKTNIGHLEAASGIAGLIKTALALEHRRIPPNLHFQQPNRQIPFDELGLRVPTEEQPWPGAPGEGLAGVNSFGFGGANAHVLLRDVAKTEPARSESLLPVLIPLSARSPDALRALAASYQKYLQHEGADVDVRDLAFNVARRRTHHEFRAGVVCDNVEQLLAALEACAAERTHPALVCDRAARASVAPPLWVFSGQGTQWWAMGRQLLETEPLFRDTVRRCDELIRELGGWSLWDELTADQARSRLHETQFAQPAIFALQVGLAALWQSWGVTPGALVGHSVGEVAAAYIAGVLTFEDAVRVIFHRGRCMEFARTNGRMLAVGMSLEQAQLALEPFAGVEIAAMNGPTSVTLAGPAEPLEGIARELEASGVFCRFLQVQYAFHSALMDPVEEPLREALRSLRTRPATIPLLSTVSGEFSDGTDWNVDYWWRNVRQPVRFAQAIGRAAAAGHHLGLELGAHPVLGGAVLECFQRDNVNGKVLPSLRRDEDERGTLLRSLTALYALGLPVRWQALAPTGRPVRLPTYPWRHQRHWHESEQSRAWRVPQHAHVLRGPAIETPTPTFQAPLDTAALAYLEDHRLDAHALFPATGYLEIALSAAESVYPQRAYALEEVRFVSACFLGAGAAKDLRTTCNPADGSFQIHGRDREASSGWTLHAEGVLRGRSQPMAPPVVDMDALRARCARELSAEQSYAALLQLGLAYGPAFRGIRRLWLGDGEALAEVELPSSALAGLADYRFHPALLDACVQAVFGTVPALLAERGRKAPYLPVEVAELRVYGTCGARVTSYARLREQTREALVADLLVIDETGAAVLEIRGLRCQRLGRELGMARNPLAQGLYEYRFELQQGAGRERAPRLAVPMLTPPELGRALTARVAELLGDLPARAARFEREVRPLVGTYASRALEELADGRPLPRSFDVDSLMAELKVAPLRRRSLERLLEWLTEDGVLSQGPSGWALLTPQDSAEPPNVTKILALEPGYFSELTAVMRTGGRLAALLRGERLEHDLSALDGSSGGAELLGRGTPLTRFYTSVVELSISRLLQDLDRRRGARILELGVGVESLARGLLSRLPAEQTEYVIADADPARLAQAERELAAHSGVRCRSLDVAKPLVEQGFFPHTFDLIVVSEALGAAPDPGRVLAAIGELLASDGRLVFANSLRQPRWVELVLEARASAAGEPAPQSPISLSGWRELFARFGLDELEDLTDSTGAGLDGAVLVARAPRLPVASATSAAAPRRWLIARDQGGYAEKLRALLEARGQSCTLVAGARPEELWSEAIEQARGGPPFAGFIHCGGLDSQFASELGADALQVANSVLALDVVALAKAWQAASTDPVELVLVTRRALPGAPTGAKNEPIDPTQTALVGLARVLANECPGMFCRTFDLGDCDTSAELDAVAEELCVGSAEDEVALRGELRFVERYLALPGDAVSRREAAEGEGFRLELDGSNSLDGLALRPSARHAPGPGEVELEVLASGLNFSDVLKGLGLYPGLGEGAVPLGIECSGRVVRVGAEVSEFAIGDAVLTMAPFTFASYRTIPAALVAHMPPGLSFEEAATVPVAFLTAHHALHHLGRMQSGERVLIHSAAGGVGLAAIQLARAAGAEVFATAGTPEKRELLRALGVAHVMDSRSLAFVDEVLEATGGQGVDLLLNSLGGEALTKSLRVLADYGRFLEIGKRDIYQNTRLGLLPFRKSLSFMAIDLDRLLRTRPALLAATLRELTALFRAGKLSALPYRTFPIASVHEAFEHMSQGKHMGKIVVSLGGRRPTLAEPRVSKTEIRGDASYLVTGGLGGFGLIVARWLVDSGARHLVLVGRQGASTPEAESAVDALRSSGCEVVVARADVADERALAEVLASVAAGLPPLRGIVHAAMVLDDCMLQNLTAERWRRVEAPKVLGAWNLHRQTKQLPLDFFVCFSSMSAVFGLAGQASYAAANAFLDGLAAHRRACGLPAVSIDWGVLGQVGVAARDEKLGARFARFGISSFSPDEARGMLSSLFAHSSPQVGVMRLDWSKFRSVGISDRISRRFERLVQSKAVAENESVDDSGSLGERLAALDEPGQKRLLDATLRDKIARVLGAAASDLDMQCPLNELGLDSIMSVELRNWISSQVGIELPTVELVRGPSLDQLVALMLKQLGAIPRGDDVPAPPPSVAPIRLSAPLNGFHADMSEPELVAKVAELSGDELDSMLRELSVTHG